MPILLEGTPLAKTDRTLWLAALTSASALGGVGLGWLVGHALGLGSVPTGLLALMGAGVLGALPTISGRHLAPPSDEIDRHRVRALFGEGVDACLWSWSPDEGRAWFSPRWQPVFGFVPDPENPRASWLERVHPADKQGLVNELRRVTQAGATQFEYLHRVQVRPDRERWVRLRGAAMRDETGRTVLVAGSALDVTDQHRAEAELTHGAFHDPLTELPNRALFLDRVRHALARARRDPDHRFAVLHLDLDRFSMVNDGLGHRQGDQLLIQLSRRLLGSVRPGDTVARLGGDEFTILLEPVDSRDGAEEVAQRFHDALAAPFSVGDRSLVLTATIGIAMSGPQYTAAAELVRDADTAKNQAKREGPGSQRLFDSQMHRNVLASIELETMLREALDEGQLRVEYQPIVSVEDLDVVGYEALVRWDHPTAGTMHPSEFVPLAERTGLIHRVGLFVLREALSRQSGRLSRTTMSVNLSPAQFRAPTLVQDVAAVLEETGADPSLLRLEITETSVMEDEERASQVLHGLKELGCALCIDDFGTGYSSLLTLHRFPIDVLKVDREFVSRMDPKHPGMVQTIIMLARSLEMETVAEGVETEEQRDTLIALGCDALQGFLFSPAVPAGDAWELEATPTWPKLPAVSLPTASIPRG